MKAFICACVVFLITAAAVFSLSVYTRNEVAAIKEICDSLPEKIENGTEAEFDAVYGELLSKWKRFSDILQLAVNHNEKNAIDIMIREISEYRKHGDQSSYSASKAKLSTQLKNLIETESTALSSIF